MLLQRTKFLYRLGIVLTLLTIGPISMHAQWTSLTNVFPGSGHAGTCLLLTDGTVMCHEFDTNHWHRLNPDNTGSYVNGTWDSPKAIADMPNGTDQTNVAGNKCSPTACTYAPRFFSSAVLPDGRVVVIGGEYNTESTATGLVNSWTPIGFMYDPTTNKWSSQLSQPFGYFLSNTNTIGGVGDSQSVILQNGTMVIAGIFGKDGASFNPSTLAFTLLGSTGKADNNDEEAWTILPGGKILTVDATINNAFEIYDPDPTVNKWTSPGNTAGVNLADVGGNCNSNEVGPAVSRPDGTVINFSGNPAGQNAVYNISAGTWSHPANVDFPSVGGQQFTTADAPASLLPVGSVLVQASPACIPIGGGKFNEFNTPSHFFEWNGTKLTQVADPPGGGAANLTSYQGRMLLLPSGDVLFTGFNQNQTTPVDILQTYNNGGIPQDAWRPGITTAPSVIGQGQSYSISGTMFNGFSEGASYGDQQW
jgi:Kelch motif